MCGSLTRDPGEVITHVFDQATALPAHRREQIDTAIRYLSGRATSLRHDQVLQAGWPIATGIIEGAVRHIVADRLDVRVHHNHNRYKLTA